MCKYCKKLKEIKDLECKRLQDCINSWKRRDKKARDIITSLLDIYAYEVGFPSWECNRPYNCLMDSVVYQEDIVDIAVDFLNCDYVGK